MSALNNLYNSVFKNNKIRECAQKAAKNLKITMQELKPETVKSEYEDQNAIAEIRQTHLEKMRVKKFKLISEHIEEYNLHNDTE